MITMMLFMVVRLMAAMNDVMIMVMGMMMKMVMNAVRIVVMAVVGGVAVKHQQRERQPAFIVQYINRNYCPKMCINIDLLTNFMHT